MLIAIVRTQESLQGPGVELVVATMYSFGFIVVVLGRSELFTEQTTLAIMPLLTVDHLVPGGPPLADRLCGKYRDRGDCLRWPASGYLSSPWHSRSGGLRSDFCSHRRPPCVGNRRERHPGGLVDGPGFWLVAAVRDTISQIFIIWIITAAIGFAQLHHAILGAAEVTAGIWSGGGTTIAQFLLVLASSTLGNAIGGGCFVALLKFGHAAPAAGRTD